MASAVLTTNGQITIPSSVCQKLGVVAGDRLEFVEFPGGQFALLPAIGDVRTLKGIIPKRANPVSVEEMGRITVRRGVAR